MSHHPSPLSAERRAQIVEESYSAVPFTLVERDQNGNLVEGLAKKQFATWNASLAFGHKVQSGIPVSLLYTPQSILHATVSGAFRQKPSDTLKADPIEEYFDHFTQRDPVGTVTDQNVKSGQNFIMYTGKYTFDLNNPGAVAKCDFTFIAIPVKVSMPVKQQDGSVKEQEVEVLKHLHHHSSLEDHAAKDPIVEMWSHSLDKNYKELVGNHTQRNRGTQPDELETLSLYHSALEKTLEKGTEISKALVKEDVSITFDKDADHVDALGDGYISHVAHMNVRRGDVVVKHRVTKVYDPSGVCVCSQLSRDPENPEGVKFTPSAKGSVPSHAPARSGLTK